MKMENKKSVLVCLIIFLATVSGTSIAESKLTGNVGIASDYFFRGTDQGSGTTPSAGVDYDLMDGLALGAWIADVTQGLEYDLYGSFSGETSDFSYSVGFTGYFYTGDFDDTYTEINLNGGFGPVSIEIAIGKHDFVTGGDEDYSFIAATYSQGPYYATIGAFGRDQDGRYLELGYNKTFMELDTTLSLISADDDIGNAVDKNGNPDNDISLVFSVVNDFDL